LVNGFGGDEERYKNILKNIRSLMDLDADKKIVEVSFLKKK